MKRLLVIYVMATLTMSMILPSCIDDSFTTSPSDQPLFSVDTLKMGTVFTEELTTTHRFTVSNPHDKSLSISRISLSGDGAEYFRLNVDGFSGREFSEVEIRGKDSIYVFVEATLPASDSDLPVEINADIDFLTNGIEQSVVINAFGQDVVRLRNEIISSDTRLDAARPYQIFDSLVVGTDATLTLPAGTSLLFHDKARLVVRGRLVAEGTPDSPVTLAGDRTGNVVTDIPFDLMSRQWQGVVFHSASADNYLSHTIIKNTVEGVIVDGIEAPESTTSLTLQNCRLRNSGATVLYANHADIKAIGCEFGEAAYGLVCLVGGTHTFNHCTFANYYLFSVISGAAIQFWHFNGDTDDESGMPYMSADFGNCIIYGLGSDLSHSDFTGTGIILRNCLLKSEGSDDDNFINCLWNTDPLYYTIRNKYLFDYRLHEDSPAIGAADPGLTLPEAHLDFYGLERGSKPDLGAYVYTPEEKD